jgi:hypothetical protein
MKFYKYLELCQMNFSEKYVRRANPLRHSINGIEYVPTDVIGNFKQVK